ncbi:cysteine hydrolase family protein [Alicyclobacillus sp. SO9]|uniref:cysteine hydrolase family protein n=1 Tax=Alicyclobacillus sp. SO9 TaxID=2665646 RepID=UPI0018E7BD95|nr:isochorismatase family cysteine hydrolase [Alicyclobacillus sp. SO9]QQE76802.1 cysteine hydrolase [Alicyclobacillus sp. SO9]
MPEALIVIDYTNDFIADEGSLTCGQPGQDVDKYITDLTKKFVQDGRLVVMAVDVHDEGDPYHPETKLFPPHNLRGTEGRKLYGQLGTYITELADAGFPDNFKWMDKTRYSAFAGTDLELTLRSQGITQLHLVGVCTDICVLHTAVDAYNKSFQLTIHSQGVASFDPQGHDWALRHFSDTLGASII